MSGMNKEAWSEMQHSIFVVSDRPMIQPINRSMSGEFQLERRHIYLPTCNIQISCWCGCQYISCIADAAQKEKHRSGFRGLLL